MRIVINAKGDEYEVLAIETKDHSHEAFMKMYVGLTEWMTENAETFKQALGRNS